MKLKCFDDINITSMINVMFSKALPGIVITFSLLTSNVTGQQVDPNYHVKVLGTSAPMLSTDNEGNLFIFGYFHDYDGKNIGRIVKIAPDGSRLPFEPLFADAIVSKIKVLPSGKILISGYFSRINNTPVNQLLRLNPDGTIDDTFVSALQQVRDFDVQSDGKIIAVSDRRFYRLLSDGSLDDSFNADADLFTSIQFCIGSNDEIYYSMLNTMYKLNAAGGSDHAFLTGDFDGNVWTMHTQADGKILVCGDLTRYNNYTSQSIVRINTNGEADPTFRASGATGSISAVLERPDGHLVVAGNFSTYNTVASNVVELTSDGSFSRSIGFLTINIVSSVAESEDGKITIAGEFHSVMNSARFGVARFNADYSLDESFTPAITSNNQNVRTMQVQDDGSLYVGGDYGFFGLFDGPDPIIGRIANIHPDGTINSNFVPFFTPANNYGSVYDHLILPDKKIVASGIFGNGWRVIRLNEDGSKDGTFADGAPGVPPQTIVKHGDEILLGGSFTTYNGIPTSGLAAITTDGEFIRAYEALPQNSHVQSLAFQSDNKLVLLGSFPFPSGAKSLIRLNTEGELDAAFNTVLITGNYSELVVDNLDNIYVVGSTLKIGTETGSHIAKFDASGRIDVDFYPWKAVKGFVHLSSIEILPENKIAIGGIFDEISGYQSPGFAILDSNGKYVSTPQPIFGKGTIVTDMVFHNGQLFLSGILVRTDYQEIYGIKKILLNDITVPQAPTDLTVEVSNGIGSISWIDNSNDELAFVLERSTSGGGFMAVDTIPFNTNATQILLTPNTTNTFRLRAFNFAGSSAYTSIASVDWYPFPQGEITLNNSAPSESTTRLTWSFLLEHHEGFVIQRTTGNSSDFESLDTLLTDAVTYDDSIERNVVYRYRIGAFNANGIIFSDEIQVEWTPLPDGSLSISVSLLDAALALVKWEGPVRYHDGYIVQRKPEGSQIVTIDTVAAHLDSFIDEIEAGQALVYRVSPYNVNGNVSFESSVFKWSPITNISGSDEQNIKVFPIPTQRYLKLNIPQHSALNRYSIKTLEGRTLTVPVEPGDREVIFDLTELPAGVYLLQYQFADKIHHYRVMRQ